MSDDPNQEYLDLVEPTLESAREFVENEFRKANQGKLTDSEIEHYIQNDPVVQIKLEAKQYDQAVKVTGVNMRDMNRMCLELIYRVAEKELWRYAEDGEMLASLLDWATNRLGHYIEERTIQRFVNAVERMLLPIDIAGVVKKDTGEVVTGLDIVRNANLSEICDRSYTYIVANNEQKETLAVLLYDKAPRQETRAFHKEVMENAGQNPDPDNPATPTVVPRIKIPMRVEDVPGGWQIHIDKVLSESEVKFLQAMLGSAVEFSWVQVVDDVV